MEKGRPLFASGRSANDTDFLRVMDWKGPGCLFKEGTTTKINGHPVIIMETAVKEGIRFGVPGRT